MCMSKYTFEVLWMDWCFYLSWIERWISFTRVFTLVANNDQTKIKLYSWNSRLIKTGKLFLLLLLHCVERVFRYIELFETAFALRTFRWSLYKFMFIFHRIVLQYCLCHFVANSPIDICMLHAAVHNSGDTQELFDLFNQNQFATVFTDPNSVFGISKIYFQVSTVQFIFTWSLNPS